MPRYLVTMSETTLQDVYVDAPDEHQAKQIGHRMANAGDIMWDGEMTFGVNDIELFEED